MSPRRTLLVVSLAVAVAGAEGCAGPSHSPFDRQRAWADLVAQCDLGPRVPGTEAHAACADLIESRLREAGWHVERDVFTPRIALLRREIECVNLIATTRADASPTMAFSAHWDTRPIADNDPDPRNRETPILGANDGGSGVAVLLEVARCLAQGASAEAPALVFFDAEDLGTPERFDQWCLGSRHFSGETLDRLGWNLRRAINVDMVGGKTLQLPREAFSMRQAPEFTDHVWHLGRRRYPDVYVNRVREVFDDHVPMQMRGIKSIDIIDIAYPSWHTLEDTPEACSADSLAAVGEVLLDVVESARGPAAN